LSPSGRKEEEALGRSLEKKIDFCQICVFPHFGSLDRFVSRLRYSADLLKMLCFLCRTFHPLTDLHNVQKYVTFSTFSRSGIPGLSKAGFFKYLLI